MNTREEHQKELPKAKPQANNPMQERNCVHTLENACLLSAAEVLKGRNTEMYKPMPLFLP